MEHSDSAKTIRTPNDRFVKAVFGRPDLCADFLEVFVPSLGLMVRQGSLKRENEHFVDPQLSEKITDLLFSGTCGDRSVCAYFLFEHRSRPHPLTPLHLARYMVRIWDYWEKANPKTAGHGHLPVIIPLVVYAGKRAWKCSTEFADLTGCLVGLEEHTMRFRHVLVDLSRVDEQLLRNKLWLWMVCGLMRATTNGTVQDWFHEVGSYWDELLSQPRLTGLVETMLRYCIEADKGQTFSTIEEVAASVPSSKAKGQIMSLAEKLIQQGRQEGRQEGRQQGRQEGRQEGRAEGLERGELVGQIRTFQDLLGLPETPSSDLAELAVPELRKRLRGLRTQLGRRR